MNALILIALAGFAAQLVDGGIGMGFGVTSTTVLIVLAGLGPAQASAVVHIAQMGTTAVSGFSHWRFGNVSWPLVLKLGLPGAVAGCAGATVLSMLPLDAARPITSAILIIIGLNLIRRFSQGRVRRSAANKAQYSRTFLVGLGSAGGFIDATGGGGWGPVTTSTLLGLGREHPRYIIGTVSAAEFLVTMGASLGFVLGLWNDIVDNALAVVVLVIGGMLAAPVAAWIVSRMNPVALGGFVGSAIVALNLPQVVNAVTDALEWTMPIETVVVQVCVLVAGIAATVHGVYRYRRNLRAEAQATSPRRVEAEPSYDDSVSPATSPTT